MDTDLAQRVADRLRSLRSSRSLSQRALADASGIALRTIEDLERGRYAAKAETIVALARALHCSTDDLLRARAHENDRSHSTDPTNATP